MYLSNCGKKLESVEGVGQFNIYGLITVGMNEVRLRMIKFLKIIYFIYFIFVLKNQGYLITVSNE